LEVSPIITLFVAYSGMLFDPNSSYPQIELEKKDAG